MSTHYSLTVLRLEGLSWRRTLLSKVPNLYIQVQYGNVTRRTRTIKKNMSPDWSETLTLALPSSDESPRFNICVKHEATWTQDRCVGCIDVDLADLLDKCANGEAAQLSLEKMPGNSYTVPTGVLHLRLEVTDSMATVTNDSKAAGQAVQRSGIMRSAEAAESAPVAVVDAAEQLSEDADLYKSIGSLLSKLDVFVNVIDDLSKVHPYLNFAWQVTSVVYKGVSSQFKADKQIAELVGAMEEAFDFVRDTDSLLDKVRNLEQTIIRLLRQTTECCLFIQQYTSHSFLGRMLSLSSSSEKIDGFKRSLIDFKNALDSGIALHSALLSARMSDKVDELLLQQRLLLLHNRLDPDKMDAFNRPQCLPGTRVSLQSQIIDWMLLDTDQNVLWLYGVAGSGKSTVSTTIAEYFRGISRLGAFLFFERGKSEPASVIRTIAYKLASFDSSIAKHVVAAIERDNDIAMASAANQFEKLLLEPLTSAAAAMQGPIIVVLDAMDECGTAETRRNLIQLFQRELPKLPKNFRFLITSRREISIDKALSQPSTRILELDYRTTASQDDVLRYIDFEMRTIMQEKGVRVPSGWPWDANVRLIAKAADGLFIWASTAVKLVDCDNPFRKLKDLVSNSRSLSGLNQLYDAVLEGSGISFDDETSKDRFSQVFGLILLSKTPLSDTTIDGILGFPLTEPSQLILSRLQSVLVYTPGAPIHLFHSSFADYLMSSEGFGNPWFVDILAHKSFLVTRCFDIMKSLLQFNICGIESSYIPNERIDGLHDRVEQKIPPHLAYVCFFWAHHLNQAPFSPTLLDELSSFLYCRLLYWFEALSLLRKVNRAGTALLDAMTWTAARDAELLAFLKDARRLVTQFHLPISQATPHIYLSALPLSSKESKVSAYYSKHSSSAVRVDRRGLLRHSPLLKELIAHTGNVESVGFSPDGTRVVSGSEDRTIRVWDAEGGELVSGPFAGHSDWVCSVAFSPDGTRIVSGSRDHTIRVCDAESGEIISGPFVGHLRAIWTVAFSPDGKFIASGAGDNMIRLWNAESGTAISEPFKGHTSPLSSVAFSPDGTRVVSGSHDKTILVWDVESGKVISGPIKGHTDVVESVAFSPDGKQIVSGSHDRTIRVWDAQNGELVLDPFEGHTERVWSVAFSSDGARIVSGSMDKTIRIWDAKNGEVISVFEGHTDRVLSVAFSPDGSRIASGSVDKTVRIWDAENGVGSVSFEERLSGIGSVAFSPDGLRIVSASRNKMIRIWDAKSGEIISGPFIGDTDCVRSVAFSPDGKHIVSGFKDKMTRVWDAESGKVLSELFEDHRTIVRSFAVSHDGKRIVTGCYDGTIMVWDAENRQVVTGPIKGHAETVLSVAFSCDGRRIVSGSIDKTIRVWDTEDGEPLSSSFKGHTGFVTSVAFSPDDDGKHVVSGSGDGTIRIWDVAGRAHISGLSEAPSSGALVTIALDEESISDWTLAVDGWISGRDGELLLWIPQELRPTLWRPRNTAVFSCPFSTRLDFTNAALGKRWHECFNPLI